MVALPFKRKKLFVNRGIQGAMSLRFGFYWVVYHVCLWHGAFMYFFIRARLAQLTGSGRDVVLDSCDGTTLPIRIIDARSSQPEDQTPGGDGHTQDDILFDEQHVCVRSERPRRSVSLTRAPTITYLWPGERRIGRHYFHGRAR